MFTSGFTLHFVCLPEEYLVTFPLDLLVAVPEYARGSHAITVKKREREQHRDRQIDRNTHTHNTHNRETSRDRLKENSIGIST